MRPPGGIGKGLGLYGHRDGTGRVLFATFSGSREKFTVSAAFETQRNDHKRFIGGTADREDFTLTYYRVEFSN